MPIVPIVRQEALPGVNVRDNAPLEVFGGGQGIARAENAGQNLLEVGQKFALQAKKDADDALIEKSKANLLNQYNEFLWNPESGAMGKKGEDAFGIKATYSEQFDKAVAEIHEKTLNNDEQRARFSQYATGLKSQFTGQLDKHSFDQFQDVQKASYIGSVKAQQDDMVYNYMEPGKIDSNLSNITQLVDVFSDKTGVPLGSDEHKQAVKSATSEALKLTVGRMVDNGQDARGIVKKYKEYFTKKDYASVSSTASDGAVLGEAQRASRQIIAKDPNASITDMISQASNIKNPKAQDKTQELLRKYEADRNNARNDLQRNLRDEAVQVLSKTHDWDAYPISKKNLMSGDNLKWLEDYAKGSEPSANGRQFISLSMMAANADTREQFKNTPLEGFQKDMTRSEWRHLFDTQTKLREKDEDTSELLDYQDSTNTSLKGALENAGITNISKWNHPLTWASADVDKPNLIKYLGEFNNAVKLKEKALGRKLVKEESDKIANDLTTKIVIDNSGKRQVNPLAPKEVIPASDIPPLIRESLKRELQIQGWPVTDDLIVEYYLKGIDSGRIKPNAGK